VTLLSLKNRAESTLASGITDVATTLVVATGEGSKFPTSNFLVTIDDEILLCSSRASDSLTVSRGQESTTPVEHDAGAKVKLRITAGTITELQTESAKLNMTTHHEESRTFGSQYQNSSTCVRLVTVNAYFGPSDYIQAYIGSASAATRVSIVGTPSSNLYGWYSTLSFIVPAGWYYKVTAVGATLFDWHEWDLYYEA
jgi:hypothetical protein